MIKQRIIPLALAPRKALHNRFAAWARFAQPAARNVRSKPIDYSRVIYNQTSRGVAQPGSAPALGAGGRRFKSYRPDQF